MQVGAHGAAGQGHGAAQGHGVTAGQQGAAGQGHGIAFWQQGAAGQGQGIAFWQQGAAGQAHGATDWHGHELQDEQHAAMLDCAPSTNTNKVPSVTNDFFMINISFFKSRGLLTYSLDYYPLHHQFYLDRDKKPYLNW